MPNYTNYSAADLEALTEELLRVTSITGVYHTFTLEDGTTVQGATESDVVSHLTSGHDYKEGRKFRFPGAARILFGILRDTGFKTVTARNYRNQRVTVVTL